MDRLVVGAGKTARMTYQMNPVRSVDALDGQNTQLEPGREQKGLDNIYIGCGTRLSCCNNKPHAEIVRLLAPERPDMLCRWNAQENPKVCQS